MNESNENEPHLSSRVQMNLFVTAFKQTTLWMCLFSTLLQNCYQVNVFNSRAICINPVETFSLVWPTETFTYNFTERLMNKAGHSETKDVKGHKRETHEKVKLLQLKAFINRHLW